MTKINNEVQTLIDKTINNPLGIKVYVNEFGQVILIPELNVYFSLTNIDAVEFKCKLLYECSVSVNNDNLDVRSYICGPDSRLEKFINYMLDTSLTLNDFEAIYCRFRNGRNYVLCLEFIKSNCDISLLYNKNECDKCNRYCFKKRQIRR